MAVTAAEDAEDHVDLLPNTHRQKIRVDGLAISSTNHAPARLLAFISLVVLCVQNALQVLLIRYARTRPTTEMFFSSTAVVWSEVLKLITCMLIVSIQQKSVFRMLSMVYTQLVGQPYDTAKVCVPSLIYTVQNNLLYIAVSHLPAATFMVSYQLKILTTAVFSVCMLGKKLSVQQWGSLLLLFVGVSVVQLQEQTTAPKPPSMNGTSLPDLNHAVQSPIIGMSAVIVACVLSGFSGVYFEIILKGGGEVTVWMRNIQLAVLSIPISYATMTLKDGSAISAKGGYIFYGYDAVVWIIIATYALGGLTVAVVIKFADNILKGFATSLAIVLACVVSVYLFGFQPSPAFLIGTVLVCASIYIYSKFPPVKR